MHVNFMKKSSSPARKQSSTCIGPGHRKLCQVPSRSPKPTAIWGKNWTSRWRLSALPGNAYCRNVQTWIFIQDDQVHASPLGVYLSMCVLYGTIFDRSPVGATDRMADTGRFDYMWNNPKGWQLSDEDAEFLQRIAWETVAEYAETTANGNAFAAAAQAGSANVSAPASTSEVLLDETTVAQIEGIVEQAMIDDPIPGFELCVVKDGQVAYSEGFGVANLEEDRPVTPQSLLMQGSVTKSMTAMAVLRLAEQGLIDLDAPVTDYLPYFSMADERYKRDHGAHAAEPPSRLAGFAGLLAGTARSGHGSVGAGGARSERNDAALRTGHGMELQQLRLLRAGSHHRRGERPAVRALHGAGMAGAAGHGPFHLCAGRKSIPPYA